MYMYVSNNYLTVHQARYCIPLCCTFSCFLSIPINPRTILRSQCFSKKKKAASKCRPLKCSRYLKISRRLNSDAFNRRAVEIIHWMGIKGGLGITRHIAVDSVESEVSIDVIRLFVFSAKSHGDVRSPIESHISFQLAKTVTRDVSTNSHKPSLVRSGGG